MVSERFWILYAFIGVSGCFYNPKGSAGASETADGTSSPSATAGETMSIITSGTACSDGVCADLGATTPSIECRAVEEPGDIPDAFVGQPYTYEVTALGSLAPYSGWTDKGSLPPGLTLMQLDADSAVITGVPMQSGQYNVTLEATDDQGAAITTDCGNLEIWGPIQIESKNLFDVFPDGCVRAGTDLNQMIQDGIVVPIPGAAAPTCSLVGGRGMGNRDFDGDGDSEFPPGIAVDGTTCELSGTVNPALRFGIYAWITTIEQSAPAYSIPATSKSYIPYCAPQPIQAGTAYDIVRDDAGMDATLEAGHVLVPPGATSINFGSAMPVDPQVRVTYNEQCQGACFFAYFVSSNTLSSGSVSASPAAKFPAMGFEGFTHAITVNEDDAQFVGDYGRRAFVTNISFDYCMAQNDQDCGNTEPNADIKVMKIKQNGGNSNYEFGLVVLPVE